MLEVVNQIQSLSHERPISDGHHAISLKSLADIMSMSGIEWVIDQMLPLGELSIVYGAPEKGKTFAVLHTIASIAQGSEPFGRAVLQGSACYITDEGLPGLKQRLQAWQQVYGELPADAIGFYTEPLNLMLPEEADALGAAIMATYPSVKIIAIDPLVAYMAGGDEDKAQDMNLFIAGLRRIIRKTGAHVMVVHHTGKTGKRERGSSVLKGAANTMIFVDAPDDLSKITLTCKKQKDGEKFAPIVVTMRRVEVEDDVTSLVVAPEEPTLLPIDLVILNRLRDAKTPLGFDELREAMRHDDPDMQPVSDKKLRSRITVLEELGYITIERRGQSGKHVYHLTGQIW